MRINIASVLTFVALLALILDPKLGSMSALVFLAAGGMLIATNLPRALQAVLRFWYLMILPAYCALSVLWSQFPELSLRYAVQLALTLLIAIAIADRLPPAIFVRRLFAAYGVGILASVLFGQVRHDIGAWVGIFGSKNAFAAVIAGFLLVSFGVAFDRTAQRWLRAIAVFGLVISWPLLLKADSMGWLLFPVPALGVGFAVLASRRLSAWQKVVAAGLVLGVGLLAVLTLLGFHNALFAALLKYTGKDPTLTGRTDLWAYGMQVIRDHPLLGVGYKAFWVQGYPPAEMLWKEFGIASRSGFNFHNTYISNTVEIGLIGIAIEIVFVYAAFFRALRWGLARPAGPTACFAAYLATVVCSSFVEVTFFAQFSLTTVVVIGMFVYVTRATGELSAPPARARPIAYTMRGSADR